MSKSLMNVKRCNKRYGNKLICKRMSGHTGNHAIRLTLFEMNLWRKGLTYNRRINE